jgi:hypothetical protein
MPAHQEVVMRCTAAGAAALALLVLAGPAWTMDDAAGKTQRVVIAPQYGAGGVHRWLWGDDYRDLWTAPIEVEVLDLQGFAGGL